MNPIRQFSLWFRMAAAKSPGPWFDPTAMTLATTDKSGHVTARIVLLKQFGREGFTFFTNYDSLKARQLAENPRGALVFFWPHLGRQVRIEGRIEKVSHAESEQYFHSRPRPSQLAGSVSPQSQVIRSRQDLMDRFKRLRKKLTGQVVPLPENWGGYRLIPETLEFWHHRAHRLHDRVNYRRMRDGSWKMSLLAP